VPLTNQIEEKSKKSRNKDIAGHIFLPEAQELLQKGKNKPTQNVLIFLKSTDLYSMFLNYKKISKQQRDAEIIRL
jgi:hypothetical protein